MSDAVAITLGVGASVLITAGTATIFEYLRLPPGMRRQRRARRWLPAAWLGGAIGIGVLLGVLIAGSVRS
jgi:hypothetical protein